MPHAPKPPSPTVDITEALAAAARWVLADPGRAAAQAREVLRVAPNHPQAQFLLGAALRRLGEVGPALSVLAPLARLQPNSPQVQYELALVLQAVDRNVEAERALRRAVALKPDWPEPWRALADVLWLKGDVAGADAAYARHIAGGVNDPELRRAAEHLCHDQLAPAEAILRAYLKVAPDNVAAIRMLAEIGTRLGRYGDAEGLLSRCLELAPSFLPARHNYAIVLYRQNRAAEALAHIDHLLRADPRDPGYRNLKAAALSLVGDYAGSIRLYEQVLAEHPGQPKGWLSYGHALKTAGRRGESIAAYRRAIALRPREGEAYWSLANLKTFRFTDADLAAMTEVLDDEELEEDDRLHLHYALGKALEDQGDYAASFGHYAEGARIRRGQIDYSADENRRMVERTRTLFTAEFLSARAGLGAGDPAPIFVVGLPRSGSTLVEQILASHSEVEGTMELPDIFSLSRALERDGRTYPEVLAELEPERLVALGEAYIERTRIQRRLGRMHFIDKMPNNFAHLGFIQLILPNAKIIDARRCAMATCFSAFKQHFARGQNFSYDLTELGLYYRDYVALMDHFDTVSPVRVHRVLYENMVDDTEGEVRRLLDYCGLEFEPNCLNFHQNDRAVRTASSEQVRLPIFREGLDQWRHYDAWLSPLRLALGSKLAEH